jgi:hypothetical protein
LPRPAFQLLPVLVHARPLEARWTIAEPETSAPLPAAQAPAWSRATAVAIGALFLSWPALHNRYPLLYPDSITYLGDGRTVAEALFLHRLSDHYGMRSLIYSLGIYPFHWNRTPWPVETLQALLTAYVIWLVVRSIVVRGTERQSIVLYLVFVAVLSVLTSASWFASLVMPDILGPVLYLCIYLIVFARETLSRGEHLTVAAIAWFGATSHITHLVLAAGLCILLFLLVPIRRLQMRGRLKAVRDAALVVLLAAASLAGLNVYLSHRLSLNGDAPPFLTARAIGDGPGLWYLQQHCPQANLALCDYVQMLSNDPSADDFLWGEGGVLAIASNETRERIEREDLRFVFAAARAYPRAQLARSARNFLEQLRACGIYVFDANAWMGSQIDEVLPGQNARYLKSLQARNALPLDFFSDVLLYWTLIASVCAIAIFGLLLRSSLAPRLAGLGVVIVSTVVANAFVTGVFSNVEDRYQGRVIWLIPFLAGALALAWLDRRRREGG